MLGASLLLGTAAFFAALLVCIELGFRIGRQRVRDDPKRGLEGVGPVEAAILGLLGLLLAFAFEGGMSRLDARREMIVEEANAIETAYLRLDLIPAEDQEKVRLLFRDYLASRLEFYVKLRTPEEQQAWERVKELQEEIWKSSMVTVQKDPTENVARVLLPALNHMIDVTTARKIALSTHLPRLIFVLLTTVALMSGLLGGYSLAVSQHRSWIHMVVFAAAVTVTVYVVVDLDLPRFGLIRVTAADQALTDLQRSIH